LLAWGIAPATAMGAPATACLQAGDARAVASCEARQRAEREARAQAVGVAPNASDWQLAVAESRTPDPRDVLAPRPLAAILGGLVFFLVARARWREWRRARRTTRPA